MSFIGIMRQRDRKPDMERGGEMGGERERREGAGEETKVEARRKAGD